jgi:hypothetical protein
MSEPFGSYFASRFMNTAVHIVAESMPFSLNGKKVPASMILRPFNPSLQAFAPSSGSVGQGCELIIYSIE